MHSTSLYEWLIMLIFIFGGGALVLKVLCNPKYKEMEEERKNARIEDALDDYMDELEELRRRVEK